MKTKILYICLLVLLSTSCKQDSFQLDDIIQRCYDATYQEQGYDIKTIIDDYETLLVKDGILKDDSGRSYLDVYQKIITNKDFSIASSTFQEYDPWHKIDKEIAVTVFECERELIESAKQEGTKWRDLFSKFESSEINSNPDILYQVMTENLSENDMNSYYFKLKMFQLFDMVNIKWNTTTSSVP